MYLRKTEASYYETRAMDQLQSGWFIAVVHRCASIPFNSIGYTIIRSRLPPLETGPVLSNAQFVWLEGWEIKLNNVHMSLYMTSTLRLCSFQLHGGLCGLILKDKTGHVHLYVCMRCQCFCMHEYAHVSVQLCWVWSGCMCLASRCMWLFTNTGKTGLWATIMHGTYTTHKGSDRRIEIPLLHATAAICTFACTVHVSVWGQWMTTTNYP